MKTQYKWHRLIKAGLLGLSAVIVAGVALADSDWPQIHHGIMYQDKDDDRSQEDDGIIELSITL